MMRAFLNTFRSKRLALLEESLKFNKDTKVLDLGGGDGSYLYRILTRHTKVVKKENILLADIDEKLLYLGKKNYGFKTLKVDVSGKLPFKKRSFDVVFCNSVIEHATGDKEKVINLKSSSLFLKIAKENQAKFAKEIRRVGKQYFVQTPNKYFPIDSHTFLPFFIVYLPRAVQIFLNNLVYKLGIQEIVPDWRLLTKQEMKKLFPDANIVEEKFLGFTKSLIAVKSMK